MGLVLGKTLESFALSNHSTLECVQPVAAEHLRYQSTESFTLCEANRLCILRLNGKGIHRVKQRRCNQVHSPAEGVAFDINNGHCSVIEGRVYICCSPELKGLSDD